MTPGGRVANKVVLVTGAASGIGRATALLLSQEGATVVVADIAAEPGQQVVEEIARNDGKAVFHALDVSQEVSWKELIDKVLRDFDHLDVAVNNAGVAASQSVMDMPLDEWRRVMQINLDGVFLGTKYAMQAMQATGGCIINVASASGIKAAAQASAYCASKAAVRMLSKVAALECQAAGKSIRVNVVSPGGVKTPIWEKQAFWPGLVAEQGSTEAAWQALGGSEFFSAQEIAKAILFLASDESSYLNAGELVIDRGYTA